EELHNGRNALFHALHRLGGAAHILFQRADSAVQRLDERLGVVLVGRLLVVLHHEPRVIPYCAIQAPSMYSSCVAYSGADKSAARIMASAPRPTRRLVLDAAPHRRSCWDGTASIGATAVGSDRSCTPFFRSVTPRVVEKVRPTTISWSANEPPA